MTADASFHLSLIEFAGSAALISGEPQKNLRCLTLKVNGETRPGTVHGRSLGDLVQLTVLLIIGIVLGRTLITRCIPWVLSR